MVKIISPIYYRVIQKINNKWIFKTGNRVFYNPLNLPVSSENLEKWYGLTREKVVIELFRINGGKDGYYLANLKESRYYYCGIKDTDVKKILISLGIGREDPQD